MRQSGKSNQIQTTLSSINAVWSTCTGFIDEGAGWFITAVADSKSTQFTNIRSRDVWVDHSHQSPPPTDPMSPCKCGSFLKSLVWNLFWQCLEWKQHISPTSAVWGQGVAEELNPDGVTCQLTISQHNKQQTCNPQFQQCIVLLRNLMSFNVRKDILTAAYKSLMESILNFNHQASTTGTTKWSLSDLYTHLGIKPPSSHRNLHTQLVFPFVHFVMV